MSRPRKVLVVGAGAAGMSCAYHLSQHPGQFEVTLIDAVNYCGGQAFSIPIDKDRHGASWLNQGVQGGSYIFHHTLTMFARQGHKADPVSLQVSFGKGETFWTNVFPTKLLSRHQREVQRFHKMLRLVRWTELLWMVLPIRWMMKLFLFSDEFINAIALPTVALFLGTGNATPEVPSIIMERLFTSPTYGMWYPGDKLSVVSNLPPMIVFPEFNRFYNDWKTDLIKRGVKVRLSTELTDVIKRDENGVVVRTIKRIPEYHGTNSNTAQSEAGNADPGTTETEEAYDELVLCVLTDRANHLLKPTSTWMERKVLGSAKFSDDITVTHNDTEYMRQHYENFYNEEQAVLELDRVDQTARNKLGKKDFKPMYYIKEYPDDQSKLEMSFDCTNYQGQFPPSVPFDNHVFQTIFLNKDRDSHLWSIDEIDETKIIRKDWWHQLVHSFTHYLFVVPWMMFLQGKRRTRFAGSWTLVNAHEVAIISGLAAAVNLGAEYPADLENDRYAFLCFRLYYLLIYGKWYRRNKSGAHNREVEDGKQWGSGLNGSMYQGPGVSKEERSMWMQGVKLGTSQKEFGTSA